MLHRGYDSGPGGPMVGGQLWRTCDRGVISTDIEQSLVSLCRAGYRDLTTLESKMRPSLWML